MSIGEKSSIFSEEVFKTAIPDHGITVTFAFPEGLPDFSSGVEDFPCGFPRVSKSFFQKDWILKDISGRQCSMMLQTAKFVVKLNKPHLK